MAEEAIQKQDELYSDEAYREMIDAGIFYGRKKAKTHPRMKPFVLGNRNGLEIINLTKTKEMLERAVAAVKAKALEGGQILFVATQPPAEGMRALAKELNASFVDKRWLGGTLTNHRIISGRIEYYKKLKSDIERGALERYTKRERLGMEKEMQKLEEIFCGLQNFERLPAMLVIVDANLHLTAVKEARHLRIPVVAFVNTDSDPDLVNYPVLGNNKAKTGINWFLGKVEAAIREGVAARPVKTAPESKPENNTVKTADGDRR